MTEIVVAFDKSTATEADLETIEALSGKIGFLKLGLEAHTAPYGESGASLAYAAEKRFGDSVKVLKDLKLHDIGNTVAATVRNLAGTYGGITLHASSSLASLKAAVAARDERYDATGIRTALFGVTVLTDINEEQCLLIYRAPVQKKVRTFAERLLEAGIDGIVCSGLELDFLNKLGLTKDLTTLVPGGRPEWADTNDQKRVMTPHQIAFRGADYAVFGRPILAGPYEPLRAIELLYEEMKQ